MYNHKLNPLLAIPSPRDLPEVKQAIDKIQNIDKFWVKYSPAHITYPLIQDQFLNHKSQHYTHLIFCPDDLVIDDKNKIDILLSHYSNPDDNNSNYNNNKIISGYCNVDTSTYKDYANISLYDVPIERSKRQTIEDYKFMKLSDVVKYNNKNPLLEVKFMGFPLTIIPRRVMETIKFRDDSGTWAPGYGCCRDVMFCHDALRNGFKLFVDTRIKIPHLKYSDTSTSALLQQQAKTKDDYYHYYEYSKEIRIVG